MPCAACRAAIAELLRFVARCTFRSVLRLLRNDVTFHLEFRLNDEVNALVEQEGGFYAAANRCSHIGVGAAYGAVALEQTCRTERK